MSLASLIERVEGATKESIDLFIHVAVTILPQAYPSGWLDDDELVRWRFLRFEKFVGAGAWESAALALCERVLPGWCKSVVDLRPDPCEGYVWPRGRPSNIQGKSSSPALAVVAAMLRALEAQAQGSDTMRGGGVMGGLPKTHFGDPCIHCGKPHDDVAPGPCQGDPAKAKVIGYATLGVRPDGVEHYRYRLSTNEVCETHSHVSNHAPYYHFGRSTMLIQPPRYDARLRNGTGNPSTPIQGIEQ